MKSSSLTVFSGCAAAVVSAVIALATPTLTIIPPPPGSGSFGNFPQCMTGDGVMIYNDSPGSPYVWVSGIGSTFFATPGISRTHVAATSRDGVIAVGATEISGLDQVPVLWNNRVPMMLPSDAKIGSALDVSADGHVAVGYTLTLPDTRFAAKWVDGGPIQYLGSSMGWSFSQAISSSADGAVIVGNYMNVGSTDRHCVVFTAAGAVPIAAPIDYSYEPPLPYLVTDAMRITDDGTVVFAQLQGPRTGWYRIYRLDVATGAWTYLGLPPNETGMMLQAISPDGRTVAGLVQRHLQFYGYAWSAETGWFNIRQMLIDNGITGASEPLMVTGISDDGLKMCAHDLDQGYLISMTALPCRADFNHDDVVNFFDYLDYVNAFSAGLPGAEFNRDGVLDFFDYLDFVDVFSNGC